MKRKKTYFSAKVASLINNPINIGTLKDAHGGAEVEGDCGTRMVIFLNIINDTILDAKFITDGCGVSYACGSAVTEMIKNKTCIEAAKLSPDDIVQYLGGLPASDLHCADLCMYALLAALKNYEER
jgi:nitrogen fixation NifU-like protein